MCPVVVPLLCIGNRRAVIHSQPPLPFTVSATASSCLPVMPVPRRSTVAHGLRMVRTRARVHHYQSLDSYTLVSTYPLSVSPAWGS